MPHGQTHVLGFQDRQTTSNRLRRLISPMSRRFQFSLRALLAVMAGVGLVLTWILLPIFQLRRQRQIADAFSRRGMEIDYDPRLSEGHPPGPAWARLLYGDNLYVNPIAVTWHGEPPSDDDLRLLSQLKHLRRLSLAGIAVNDRYLKKLGQLKNLEELDLHATAITDGGLEQLPIFPNLKRIYLAKTATTHGGIRKLRRRVGHLPTLSISW